MRVDLIEPIRYRIIQRNVLPANPAVGELFFDTTIQTLTFWNGTQYIALGPPATPISTVPTTFNVATYGAVGDGATDCTAAFQAAINAARVAGGIVFIPGGTFRITASLNITSPGAPPFFGIQIVGAGKRASLISAVIAGAPLFDCTGSNFISFADFSVTGNAVSMPTVAFLLARNVTGSSAGNHVFNRVSTLGFFSVAALYGYASEILNFHDSDFTNNQTGAKGVYLTAANLAAQVSPFVAIAVGALSNTEFYFSGCEINQFSVAAGANDCLYLDGVSKLDFTGGIMTTTNGNAAVVFDNSVRASQILKFSGVMFDGSMTYCFHLAGAFQLAYASMESIFDIGSTTQIFKSEAASAILGLRFRNCQSVVSNAMDLYSVDFSDIDAGQIVYTQTFDMSRSKITVKSVSFIMVRPDLVLKNEFFYSDNGVISQNYDGTLVFDPPNLLPNTGTISAAIAITGAAFGDFVMVSAPYDLQGITATAYVDAAASVRISLYNGTAGAINLGNGSWKVKLLK